MFYITSEDENAANEVLKLIRKSSTSLQSFASVLRTRSIAVSFGEPVLTQSLTDGDFDMPLSLLNTSTGCKLC